MNTTEKIYEQKLLISKISKISFSLSVIAYGLFILGLILHSSFQVLTAISPLLMIVLLPTSFVLAIIDLTRKNRKKTLSIVALVLSSLYILFFISVIVIAIVIGVTTKV